MGADPKLLKAAADAHHKAISSASGPTGMTSKADWEAVNAALGRVFASVPESSVMDVYNAVAKITDPGVPAYLKSKVNGADAEKAYAAFLEFKDVVKANQVSSAAAAPVPAAGGDKIGAAAQALADQSYPFLKGVDWTSDLYLKPLPGVSAAKALKAVDKAIVMGSAMDGNLLKATWLDGLRAGRDGGSSGFKLMGGLCHSAWRFFCCGTRAGLKPCICSVCRTPLAGAVPLGTGLRSAGRVCPPRGASSAQRERK